MRILKLSKETYCLQSYLAFQRLQYAFYSATYITFMGSKMNMSNSESTCARCVNCLPLTSLFVDLEPSLRF